MLLEKVDIVKNVVDSSNKFVSTTIFTWCRESMGLTMLHAKTIHSTLKIPIKDMRTLQGKSLAIFQEVRRHICYVLIDEMNFIGARLFMQIDS